MDHTGYVIIPQTHLENFKEERAVQICSMGPKVTEYFCLVAIHAEFVAREQLRAECALLGHKPYEPPWKPIEVETHWDWWGLAKIRGRKFFVYFL